MRPCEHQDDKTETCNVFDDPDDGSPMLITIRQNRCTDAPDCQFYHELDVIV
jgi:hypothetical protein